VAVRIGPGVKYVSTLCLKRSVEQFGGWLHASGAQLGNLRGETVDSSGAGPRRCGDGGTGNQSSETSEGGTVPQRPFGTWFAGRLKWWRRRKARAGR